MNDKCVIQLEKPFLRERAERVHRRALLVLKMYVLDQMNQRWINFRRNYRLALDASRGSKEWVGEPSITLVFLSFSLHLSEL